MANRSASGQIQLTSKLSIKNLLDDNQSASVTHSATVLNQTLNNGLQANQINRGWGDNSRALTSGNEETIDLYDLGSIDIGAGAGLDGLGQALAIEEIVGIIIWVSSSSDGQLAIQPGDTNGWTPIGTHTGNGAIGAGGCLLKWDPTEGAFDVADGSSHTIKLSAVGGDVTYGIHVFGRSDDDESSSSSSSSSSTSSLSTSSSSQSSSTVSSLSSSSVSSQSSSSTT